MSEPELATKSPENDAVEDQTAISAHDSTAQTGASMGEHCTTDRPTPAGQLPTGEMTKFGEIDAYVSKPADYPTTPGKLLLLLTGGTGVHSVNNQLQADTFAKEGFVVVMPDQFGGDHAPNSAASDSESNPSLIEQVKMRAAETVKSFMIDMWLARQTPEKVLPILHKVLDAIKDEYADAVAFGNGIYAAGYCFGAKYVIILAGQQPETQSSEQPLGDEEAGKESKAPLIRAGAIAHGTLVTRDDLTSIEVPMSMVCVGEFILIKYMHSLLIRVRRK